MAKMQNYPSNCPLCDRRMVLKTAYIHKEDPNAFTFNREYSTGEIKGYSLEHEYDETDLKDGNRCLIGAIFHRSRNFVLLNWNTRIRESRLRRENVEMLDELLSAKNSYKVLWKNLSAIVQKMIPFIHEVHDDPRKASYTIELEINFKQLDEIIPQVDQWALGHPEWLQKEE